MAKLRKIVNPGGDIHYLYKCPGCGYEHAFSPAVHKFNGDVDRPTISPSLLQSNPQNHHRCHSFITAGKIEFLSDCWHHLKGQTVDLIDYSPEQLADKW